MDLSFLPMPIPTLSPVSRLLLLPGSWTQMETYLLLISFWKTFIQRKASLIFPQEVPTTFLTRTDRFYICSVIWIFPIQTARFT